MIKRKEIQVRKLKVIPPQRGMTKADLVRRQHQGSNNQLKVNQMVDQPLLLQLQLQWPDSIGDRRQWQQKIPLKYKVEERN